SEVIPIGYETVVQELSSDFRTPSIAAGAAAALRERGRTPANDSRSRSERPTRSNHGRGTSGCAGWFDQPIGYARAICARRSQWQSNRRAAARLDCNLRSGLGFQYDRRRARSGQGRGGLESSQSALSRTLARKLE